MSCLSLSLTLRVNIVCVCVCECRVCVSLPPLLYVWILCVRLSSYVWMSCVCICVRVSCVCVNVSCVSPSPFCVWMLWMSLPFILCVNVTCVYMCVNIVCVYECLVCVPLPILGGMCLPILCVDVVSVSPPSPSTQNRQTHVGSPRVSFYSVCGCCGCVCHFVCECHTCVSLCVWISCVCVCVRVNVSCVSLPPSCVCVEVVCVSPSLFCVWNVWVCLHYFCVNVACVSPCLMCVTVVRLSLSLIVGSAYVCLSFPCPISVDAVVLKKLEAACTTYCIWSVIQSSSPISMFVVSFQRNVTKRDPENSNIDWDLRLKKLHSTWHRL